MRCSIEIVRASDERSSCSAKIWEGSSPGPTVLVTANVHGDELTGIAAIHALGERLERELKKGRVVAYPSVNPTGLRARSRTVALDGVDLNRSFPGDARDGETSAWASDLWGHMLGKNPNLVIDLHADSMLAVPYAIIDPPVGLSSPVREEMERTLEACGRATGLLLLRDFEDETYRSLGLDRSLAGAMVNHAGIPAVTLEVGPRRAVDARSVDIMVDAVFGLLAHGEWVLPVAGSPTRDPVRPDPVWRRTPTPKPNRSGILVPLVPPGDRFETGEPLAEIRDVMGQVLEVLRAPREGRVVTWTELSWVEAQDTVGMLGLKERRDP